MDLRLSGRRALVTGGSHGIGLATAQALAAEGCHVAICSRSADRLDSAGRQLAATGVEVLTLQTDVLVSGDIDRCWNRLTEAWGGVDILVNNVGGGGRWGKPSIEDTDPEVWQQVYDKNAGAAVAFTRLALPHMRRNGFGRIVTVASIYGTEGGGRPWFNMAKAAEISLMKCLALTPELARSNITFNTVSPGSIMIPDTGWEQAAKDDPEGFARLMESYPLGRLGTPAEVADVICFLCSPRASLVNGANVVVDGAETKSF